MPSRRGTTSIQIVVAAVVLPLHDPVQLAEEMVVLDIISGGRLSYVAALGYQRDEYEMLGVDFSRRGRIADDSLAALLAAKTGRPFDYGGRTVTVTPPPLTEGGPNVAWGGGSEAAAKRAGRFGLDFFAQSGDESLRTVYEAAAQAAGHAPRSCFLPPNDAATTLFVADDLDAAWAELGPYLLHDARCYAAMNPGKEGSTSFSFASSIDELRAEDRSHRIVTVREAVSMVRSGEVLALHPLVGGLPPARCLSLPAPGRRRGDGLSLTIAAPPNEVAWVNPAPKMRSGRGRGSRRASPLGARRKWTRIVATRSARRGQSRW